MIKAQTGSTSPISGAVAVLLDSQNRTLILLRPKEALWAPLKWGFPGGKLEDGETPTEGAIRETLEETELEIRNLLPLELKLDTPVRAYYTRDYMGSVKIDYEHDDWAWVARDNIETYDLAPQVLQMLDWVLENE